MLLYLLSILRSENDRPCLSPCAIPDSSPNLYSLSRILRNSSSSLYSNIEVFGFFVGLFSNNNVVVTSPLADYSGIMHRIQLRVKNPQVEVKVRI